MDSIDEIKERLTEEIEEAVHDPPEDSNRDRAELEILAQATSSDEVKLREVVRGGIGNVNIGDVMMARTAKGQETRAETHSHPNSLS